MRKEHARYLACPECRADVVLDDVRSQRGERVESGTLRCGSCEASYEIVRYIPRFVRGEHYAGGFGLEWNRHARTQYDSYTGVNVSQTRFFEETKWPRQMPGEVILEVGSGSGRFTEQAASTGAMVVSTDLSAAVEANYASNGDRDNVLIVQADLYRMPLREDFFDRVLCIGVLQHTPDVERSFMELLRYLKPGGSVVVDVYRKLGGWKGLLNTKHWVRPWTRDMDPERLYRWCSWYVSALWPLARIINRIPRFGLKINRLLLIADYRGMYDLPEQVLKEWAILDTFDMLSPKYDSPQTLETVQGWFKKARLENCEVHYGYNGIEGRGRKPETSRSAMDTGC